MLEVDVYHLGGIPLHDYDPADGRSGRAPIPFRRRRRATMCRSHFPGRGRLTLSWRSKKSIERVDEAGPFVVQIGQGSKPSVVGSKFLGRRHRGIFAKKKARVAWNDFTWTS